MKNVLTNQLSNRKPSLKKGLTGTLILAFFALVLSSAYAEELVSIGPYDFGKVSTALCYRADKSTLLQIDNGDWYPFSVKENKVMHVTVPLSDLKYDYKESENEHRIQVEGVVVGKMKDDTVYFDDDKLVKVIRTFRFSKTGDKAHVSIRAEFLQTLKYHRFTRFQLCLWASQVAGMAYYAMDANNKNFSGIISQECAKNVNFAAGDLKALRIETSKGPIEINNMTRESSAASISWLYTLTDRRKEGEGKSGIININFLPFNLKSEEGVVVNKGDYVTLEYDLSLPVSE